MIPIPKLLATGCLAVAGMLIAKDIRNAHSAESADDATEQGHSFLWKEAPDGEDRKDWKPTKSTMGDRSLATRLKQNIITIRVGGQVERPGPFEVLSGVDLQAAVDLAGGATVFGSMRRVKLYREGAVQVFDLVDPKTPSILLADGDSIEIPQKNVIGR